MMARWMRSIRHQSRRSCILPSTSDSECFELPQLFQIGRAGVMHLGLLYQNQTRDTEEQQQG